ncbi:MAG: hypothetical protein ABGX22_28110, partial [Pirellulaceae bacterium]
DFHAAILIGRLWIEGRSVKDKGWSLSAKGGAARRSVHSTWSQPLDRRKKWQQRAGDGLFING